MRSAWGLASPYGGNSFPFCDEPSAADRKAAKLAAKEVAVRLKRFSPGARGLYMQTFLENALSALGAHFKDMGPIFGSVLAYVETCVLASGQDGDIHSAVA